MGSDLEESRWNHRGSCNLQPNSAAWQGSPNPASKRCPLLASPLLSNGPPARLGHAHARPHAPPSARPRRGRRWVSNRWMDMGEASFPSPPPGLPHLAPVAEPSHHAVSVSSPSPLRLDLALSPPYPRPLPGFSPRRRVSGGSCWVLGLSGVMDDGGEVRLVRKKGKKRPPAAAPAEREREADGRDRFHALWRDYHDLLKDTESKKRRLESINRRKLGLLAEVKFLRNKYSSFVKDHSHQASYRLKKQGRKIASPVGSNDHPAFGYRGATTEVLSTSKNTNFDLNHDSLMSDEGADCQGQQNHSEPVKLEQAGVDEDIMATDVNLSVCRDTGNSPASDDKRTIAWQDRVALKV